MVNIGPISRVWVDGRACTAFRDDHGRVVDVLLGWVDEWDDASPWLHWALLHGLDDGQDAITSEPSPCTA